MSTRETLAVDSQVELDSPYSYYVLALLTITYTIAFIDRQLLNLFVEPIKTSFSLSDTQISLLQGLAFMVAYVSFGPLLGRWSDIGHRRNILVLGASFWNLCTAATGLARSYGQMFGARMGVGAAEACIIPTSWSLISDYFSVERLPRALSIFLIAPFIGGGLALIFGGLAYDTISNLTIPSYAGLDKLAPWQITFVLVSLPGFIVAMLLFSVREPVRRSGGLAEQTHFTNMQIFRFFWQQRAFYLRFYTGMSCIILVLYGLPAWAPTWFMREFGVSASQVGVQFGSLMLVCGAAGVLSGPWFGSWLLRRGYEDAMLRVALIAASALLPCVIAMALAPSYPIAVGLAGLATFFFSLPLAMAAAALQLVTPNRMRGVASAIYVFSASVIGLGLGPTLIAVVTDQVFMDEMRVGWSMGIVCSIGALAAILIISSTLRPYLNALSEIQSQQLKA